MLVQAGKWAQVYDKKDPIIINNVTFFESFQTMNLLGNK